MKGGGLAPRRRAMAIDAAVWLPHPSRSQSRHNSRMESTAPPPPLHARNMPNGPSRLSVLAPPAATVSSPSFVSATTGTHPAAGAPNPNPGSCDMFMVKKRRHCHFPKRPGFAFCHVHVLDSGDPGEQRVPCPVNPQHTVRRRSVERHALVCPDLQHDPSRLPYYHRDLHCGAAAIVHGEERRVPQPPPLGNTVTNDDIVAPRKQPRRHTVGDEEPRGQEESDHHRDNDDDDDHHRSSATVTPHKRLTPAELDDLVARIARVYHSDVVIDDWGARPATSATIDAPADDPAKTNHDDVDEEITTEHTTTTSTKKTPDGACIRTSVTLKHTPQHDGLIALLRAVLVRLTSPRPAAAAAAAASHPLSSPRAMRSGGAQSLMGNVAGAFPPDLRLIELGAGKAGLALATASRFAEWGCPLPWTLVVDRGNFRRKGDGRCRDDATQCSKFHRCRVDLKDFDLDRFLTITAAAADTNAAGSPASVAPPTAAPVSSSSTCWCFVGKHLCGACTDFALSVATRSTLAASPLGCNDSDESEEGKPDTRRGGADQRRILVVATCCHQTCEWHHMLPQCKRRPDGDRAAATGRAWWRDDATASAAASEPPAASVVAVAASAVAERDLRRLLDVEFPAPLFPALASLSSWGVSGDACVSKEQEVIGRRAKRVLDWMRVLALRAAGWEGASLCHFVPTSVTKENAAIVAWKSC